MVTLRTLYVLWWRGGELLIDTRRETTVMCTWWCFVDEGCR